MEPIILASGSPRREEYFRLLGLPFNTLPSPVNEDFDNTHDPRLVAQELALRKVKKVVEILEAEPPPASAKAGGTWVFGADTLISLNGTIYGKALDRKEAGRMLLAFGGNTHEVVTAMALYNGRSKNTDSRVVVSSVSFAPLAPGEIEWYLDSGEWQDAAGAYKIQGLASCFITRIEGSYSSIVGLPLREFYVMLRDNGYPFGS